MGNSPSNKRNHSKQKVGKRKILPPLNPGTFRTHLTNGRDGSPSRPAGSLDNAARGARARRVNWVAPYQITNFLFMRMSATGAVVG